MASRSASQLPARVDHLETRVDDLTTRVDHLEETTGVASAPEAPEAPAAELPRCPGCNLPVEDAEAKRCVWCGFVFAAARPRRRRR